MMKKTIHLQITLDERKLTKKAVGLQCHAPYLHIFQEKYIGTKPDF